LEVREAMLAEVQERGLYSYNSQNLSAELEQLRSCTSRVKDERAAEAEKLSTLVVGSPMP
jgi:hypothetical protein